jgi:signal transduction histidine kinase
MFMSETHPSDYRASSPKVFAMERMAEEVVSFRKDERRKTSTAITTRWLLIVMVVSAIGIFFVSPASRLLPDFFPLFSTASVVIIFGLAGLYFYIYKFYGDEIYRLIAVGWIGNSLYMVLEGLLSIPAERNLRFAIYRYLFSQVSLIPFYLASLSERDGIAEVPNAVAGVSIWFTWIILTLFGGYFLALSRFGPTHPNRIFVVSTCGGLVYAAWTLIKIGRSLTSRLDRQIHGLWYFVLPGTFYLWALLQPFYLLRLSTDGELALRFAFATALIAKAVNGQAIVAIMLRDSDNLRQMATHRSAFEDLGALTASIEHEIKVPLQISNIAIAKMKARFQAQSEVLSGLAEIERENYRIFAATEIIEILRGGRSFYENLMSKTSIGDIVNRSIKTVKGAMKAEDVHFNSEGGVVYTKAYQPLLQQVIVNILKNSVEAIRQAGRTSGHVEIVFGRSRKIPDMAQLRISDNGCGIPRTDLRKIGLFFSTKKNKPNSGIGIFISKRILALHNAKIEFVSEEGKGTTASIFVPLWNDTHS